MAYVIAEPCIGVRDKTCVDVCPVDCIVEGPDQLYIEPSACIDCDLCRPVCPVDAIFAAEQVPPRWQHFIAKNAAYFAA